jgi:hypothetical protein
MSLLPLERRALLAAAAALISRIITHASVPSTSTGEPERRN